MQQDEQELSRTYQSLPDGEIASLHAEIATLSEVAQRALRAEIERRRLSGEALSKLCAARLRQEANFDRRERIRRRGVASYLLFHNDPKGALVVAAVVLMLALLSFIVHWH